MTKHKRSPNAQMTKARSGTSLRHSDFVIPSTFDIRHSSFARLLIRRRRRWAGIAFVSSLFETALAIRSLFLPDLTFFFPRLALVR
jgi:hypothetical protein